MTSEKDEVIALVRQIERFSKSGILIHNSEVPGTANRKTRRTTQAIAKCYVFHANAIKVSLL